MNNLNYKQNNKYWKWDYKQENEEKLILEYKKKHKNSIIDFFIKKYYGYNVSYINNMLMHFQNVPVTFDDLLSLAMIEIHNSLLEYKMNENYNFSQFYLTRFKSKIKDYLIKFSRKKDKPLNYAIEFNEKFNKIYNSLQNDIVNHALYKMIICDIQNNKIKLTLLEKKIFLLRMLGWSNKDLINENNNEKNIDNAYHRAKIKIRKYYKSMK